MKAKRLVILLLISLLFVSSAFAGGKIITDTITSPALQNSPIGDSATRNMTIYLPPSYDKGGRFPVVYLLHGQLGNEKTYVDKATTTIGDLPEGGLPVLLDELISTGKLKEMIVVMPNGQSKAVGCWFTNSKLTGNYEDYMFKDIVGYIDSHYNTIPNRDSRAIAGWSMGGYGAITLAMKHSDIFGTVVCHSTPFSFDINMKIVAGMLPILLAENPDGILSPDPKKPITTAGLYSGSAAYSPNLANPPYFVDWIIELPSGKIVDSVKNKWFEHDPLTMLNTYGANLASLNGIYFDHGNQDPATNVLPAHSKVFDAALVAKGIAHEYQTFDGVHNDKLFSRLAVSFPFMSAHLLDASEANKVAIERFFEVFHNQKNYDAIGEFYDPNYTSKNGNLEGVKKYFMGFSSAFPDYHFTIDDIIAEGDNVLTRYTVVGTQKGTFNGISPTGKKCTMTGMTLFRMANGKIMSGGLDVIDELGLLQQLGVFPSGGKTDFSWGMEKTQGTGKEDPTVMKNLILRLYDEVWNQGKLEVVDEIYAPNFQTTLVAGGREGFKKYVAATKSAFTGGGFTVEYQFTEGDIVVSKWVSTGTQTGSFMGIPATNKLAKMDGLSFNRIENGKIAQSWNSMDMLGFLTQLGVIPAPKPVDTLAANKAVVKRIDDIYNKRDLSIIDEVYSPDTVDIFSGAKGIEATKDRFAMILSALPDAHEDIFDMVAEGNIVTIRAMISATHKGTYMGIPATGKKGTVTVMGVYEVINGKITKSWRYLDDLGFLQQAGLFPTGGKTDFTWGMDKTKGTGKEDPTVMKNLILRLFNEVWNQGKLEVIDEIYAPNFQTSLVAGGKEGFKKYVAGLRAGFSDVNFRADNQFTEGDMVVSQWTVTGTQTGNFMGIPPTGKKATMVGAMFNRIENGLIAQSWNSMDMLGLMVQLGVIPVPKTPAGYDNVFFTSLTKGLNMISLPLKPVKAFTARSLANELGATAVIKYDEVQNRFVGFSSNAPDNGFTIEGGKGYIVNVSESRTVAFTGAAWTNEPPVLMAPPIQADTAWAFIVNGFILDGDILSVNDGNYTVTVRNLNTGAVVSESVGADGYFANAYADLNRKAVVRSGDKIEVAVTDNSGELVSGPFVHTITQNEIGNAVMNIPLRLGNIMPKDTALLQNFPNPFNPETWIPFQLKKASDVTITIFNADGRLVRKLELGRKDPGVYASQSKAIFWDGKNESGEKVSSGLYFYNIKAGDFSATKKMIVKK